MCNKKPKNKIAIVAGGTGGHVFPALCIADRLALEGIDVLFVTDRRGDRYLGSFGGRKIVQNIDTSTRIKLYGSLVLYFIRSIICLLRNRVDCVIGFGGYPSAPFVLAAQVLRIKTIIHEQNALLGRANRLLSILARKILISFPDTKHLKVSERNIITGNPTRFEKTYIKSFPKRNTKMFTILIIGGSQGARVFSEVIPDSICELAKEYCLNIIEQCKSSDIDAIREKYDAIGIDYVVAPFFEDIGRLYAEADLVISRAGASSIFEIIGFQKPAILIPFSRSVNGDQMANAQFLANEGAAIIIEERGLNRGTLTASVKKIITDHDQRERLSQRLGQLKISEATANVIEVVMKELAGAPGFEPGK
ncbi:MAG: undecaprenyldiphospho-muramoylpentapeptide beta-N-acetylglucosaminyltransferase [Holosporales bacterium]|nr:undecaprenyldiphospho-muramoylpentapeptide beta-N-acetylglucosaminyltransferase [Holosporales bacterium]